MCGRFALAVSRRDIVRQYKINQTAIELTPHYNVCPGMYLPVVLFRKKTELLLAKWGLVPSWSKTPAVKYSSINARKETLETSPVYRVPFQRSRCLIPATGFYEWKTEKDGKKRPYYFSLRARIFSFAGIWDVWKDAEGKEFRSCAIVTCPANVIVETIHPRMPVILDKQDEQSWITPGNTTEILKELLRPYASDDMKVHRVTQEVNNPAHDDKILIDEIKS